jgi:Ca2+-binding EF-hand superfamily protein
MKLAKFFPVLVATLVSCISFTGCHPQGKRFGSADVDGDGGISEGELAIVILGAVYDQGDTNSDGKMTLAEWLAVNPKANPSALRKADSDRDGAVSVSEIQAYAADQRAFKKLFNRIDTDKSESIDPAEAKAFRSALRRSEGGNPVEKLLNLGGS